MVENTTNTEIQRGENYNLVYNGSVFMGTCLVIKRTCLVAVKFGCL
jgi:hypothetical protein